jgi:putative ABC transport system ATP-binding protein
VSEYDINDPRSTPGSTPGSTPTSTAGEATPAIVARQLSKRVASPAGELTILDGVDLEVAYGQSLAIVGASGSGKSTLLSLLAGLDLPSDGDVFLTGTRLGGLDEDGRAALRARHVGFVFQSFQLLRSLTALENVMLALELAGAADPRGGAQANLAAVGLGDREGHYPNQLSGGEQQRVAIARAFAANPTILFADEPTGNLDQRTGSAVADLLFTFNRDRGTTLVLVTHDVALAKRCERTLELESGRALPANANTSARSDSDSDSNPSSNHGAGSAQARAHAQPAGDATVVDV